MIAQASLLHVFSTVRVWFWLLQLHQRSVLETKFVFVSAVHNAIAATMSTFNHMMVHTASFVASDQHSCDAALHAFATIWCSMCMLVLWKLSTSFRRHDFHVFRPATNHLPCPMSCHGGTPSKNDVKWLAQCSFALFQVLSHHEAIMAADRAGTQPQ